MEPERRELPNKRVAVYDADDQDVDIALKVLQQLLPTLRPHKKGSLDAATRLALILDAWLNAGEAAQVADAARPGCAAREDQRRGSLCEVAVQK